MSDALIINFMVVPISDNTDASVRGGKLGLTQDSTVAFFVLVSEV